VSYTVVNKDELQNSGGTSEFEGYLHADTEVSFILVDMQPGEGVRLHTYPYALPHQNLPLLHLQRTLMGLPTPSRLCADRPPLARDGPSVRFPPGQAGCSPCRPRSCAHQPLGQVKVG
jgi:hypothetical protein